MFGGRFNANKVKTQCRLCVGRIKLLKNKRNVQMAGMRKEVAELLRAGRGEYAWIRVEAVVREKNLSAAYEILELYLELLAVRAGLIEKARQVPPDMVEAVTSMMHAAPRVADLPELQQVRSLLQHRFGKELGPEDGSPGGVQSRWQVNCHLRRYLSVSAPQPQDKLSMLSQIVQENNVDFDVEELSIAVMSNSESPKSPGKDQGAQKEEEYQRPLSASMGNGSTPTSSGGGVVFGRQKTHPGIEHPVPQPPQHVAPPQPLPLQSSLPPGVPNFQVPYAGQSTDAYANVQTAVMAAHTAAEAAKQAAAAAAAYAAQAPATARPRIPTTMPQVFGTPPAATPAALGFAVHMENPPPHAWAPPPSGVPATLGINGTPVAPVAPAGSFKMKTKEELQRQYDAAHPSPGVPATLDTNAPPVVPVAPTGPFKMKTEEELQRQYDAAPGAPPKKDAAGGVPSAPPAGAVLDAQSHMHVGSADTGSHSTTRGVDLPPHTPQPPKGIEPELPSVPQYPPPGFDLPPVPQTFPSVPQDGIDELPSTPIVPGGINDQPHDDIDELSKRLDDLKKD